MIDLEFTTVSEIIEAFPNEQSCINHLEQLRWDGYVVSPFDASSKVYHCPNNTFKCKSTGKYFNVKTGTIFHNSKVGLQQWFIAIWLLTEKKSNLTSVALGKELNITQKTAWYIIKRIKSYYTLGGKIYGDKTFNLSRSNKTNKSIGEKEVKHQLLDWLALYQFKK